MLFSITLNFRFVEINPFLILKLKKFKGFSFILNYINFIKSNINNYYP